MTKPKAKSKTVVLNHDDLFTPDNGSANHTSDNAIVLKSFTEVISSVMNEAQFAIVQGRTPKTAIKRRPGKGGKTFSYVPHGYVTAQLNRAFGFDWDFEVLSNGNGNYYDVLESCVTKSSSGKDVITPKSIVVIGRLTIRIRNPKNLSQVIATISKTSTGEKEFVPGMTWGGMIKSAESDALKKAATRLGIALDLYWQDTDDDYLPDVKKEEPTLTPDQQKIIAELKARKAAPKEYAKALNMSIGELSERGIFSNED